jgi:hypothetical protein
MLKFTDIGCSYCNSVDYGVLCYTVCCCHSFLGVCKYYIISGRGFLITDGLNE